MEKMQDFTNICRICLQKNSALQPLFDSTNAECSEIVQKIEECAGVVLKPHEEFPNTICQGCLDCLETSYKFRILCQTSEHTLLDLIIKSELHLESIEGNAQSTQCEYVEMRGEDGEYIESGEIEMVEDMIDGEVEYCERYSPMPDDGEEEEEGEVVHAMMVHEEDLDGNEDYQTIEVHEFREVKNKSMNLRKPNQTKAVKTAINEIKQEKDAEESTSKKSYVPKLLQIQKKGKLTSSAPPRKRGRPRLNATGNTTTPVIKREKSDDEDYEPTIKTSPRSKQTKIKKKGLDDSPSSIMCEICGNIYSKPALLHVHMRRHLEEKPYECE